MLETNNPKLRIAEIQSGIDTPLIVTFEAFLTKELIEWLRTDKGIDSAYLDRLERILNANQSF